MVPKIGIIGLDQVGKTTLFRMLTHARGNGLVSTKPEAHVGVVHVPDSRVDRLATLYHSKKTVHASVEYVDTPGSVIELARAGTQMTSLREMDALAHVVRAFGEEAVREPGGSMNLQRDIENVELELILSDLAAVEKRLDRLEKDMKKQKNPALEKEHRVLEICKAALEKQTPLRDASVQKEEERSIRGFSFLSQRPMLYVFNLGEQDTRVHDAEQVARDAGLKPRSRTAVAAVCGKLESELAELDESEAEEFLSSYGLREPAATRLIRSTFGLLGLISFFTANETECRAWTIRHGTTALEAAGEVHSDFQRGFIRAEVVKFEDLASAGTAAEARNRGLLKVEGKEYLVQDGEVVYFRHSG